MIDEKSEYKEYLKWAGRAAAKCRIVEKATYALAAAAEDRVAFVDPAKPHQYNLTDFAEDATAARQSAEEAVGACRRAGSETEADLWMCKADLAQWEAEHAYARAQRAICNATPHALYQAHGAAAASIAAPCA